MGHNGIRASLGAAISGGALGPEHVRCVYYAEGRYRASVLRDGNPGTHISAFQTITARLLDSERLLALVFEPGGEWSY